MEDDICVIKNSQDLESHFDIQHDEESYGVFGLTTWNDIVMYWGQEGDVINGIKFCPFCGIRFEVVDE